MKISTRLISIFVILIISQIVFAPDSSCNTPPCLGSCNKQWKECIKECGELQICKDVCKKAADDCVKSTNCTWVNPGAQ